MLDRTPQALPRELVDCALETLETLGAQAGSISGPYPLVHGDLHYENVLHTLPGEPARWVAIDPLPCAGPPEWEPAPAIRERWDEALATGDPDRALRRRFAIICERGGLERDLARRILQAIAVDNVLWLSRSAPEVNPVVRGFLPPYRIAATWTQ